MAPSKDLTKSIFIADDHPTMLDGIDFTLSEYSYEIIGRAASFEKAKDDLEKHADMIGLLITDISFPDGSGLDLVRFAKANRPGMKVIVFSAYTSYLHDALRAGADGFALKSEDASILLEAVATVMENKKYLSPGAAEGVFKLFQVPEGALDFRHAVMNILTKKEQQILQLLHHENNKISQELNIPVRTIESSIIQIRKKLNLTRGEIIRLFAQGFPQEFTFPEVDE